MPDTLHSVVRKFSKSKTRKVKEYSGILGLPTSNKTVKVPDRNGYVYVRLRDNDSEIIQAYNGEVSPVYNLPVIVIYQGGGWKIKGRDVDRYGDWGSDSAFVPEHHFQHEFNRDVPGGDVVFVYPQQFMPVLVTPSGTGGAEGVLVQSYSFKKNSGVWLQAGGTGTPSLVFYKPLDSNARVALVYLNRDSGNPGFLINTGSSVSAATTGTHDLLQYLPSLPSSDYEPLAMVRMVSGTEAIDWENLYDIRQFFNVSTGTGGGGTPGGSDGQIQANEAGAFAGYSWFHLNVANQYVTLGDGTPDLEFAGGMNLIGDGLSPRVQLWSYGASNTGFVDFYSARGTKASPLPLQEGDSVGRGLRGFIRGTGSWPLNAPSVYIEGVASETATGTGKGAGWRVWITPRGKAPGSSTKVQALLLDERGATVPELTGTPATPDTGYLRIYPKSDGLYYLMDDGTEVGPLLGSGTSPSPTYDASRVLITKADGKASTDDHFYYDFENNVLILGANSLPITSPNMSNVVSSGTSPSWNLWSYGTGTRGLIAFEMAAGSPDAPTAVKHNMPLGRVAWRGYDGTNVSSWAATRAQVEARAVGDYDAAGSSAGSKVVTSVTPSGTTTMQDMFTVDQRGADLLYGKYLISGSSHVHMTPRYYTASGTHTWTKPAGIAYVIVHVQGGGGGGGGVEAITSQCACGNGGGGGSYKRKKIDADSLGATETIIVGGGGAGGAAGNNQGASGSASSFGSHVSAAGGVGGNGQASQATLPIAGAAAYGGGGGSEGASGDLFIAGSPAIPGVNWALNVVIPSIGGGSHLGAFVKTSSAPAADENGVTGQQYGGGGGGGKTSNAAVNKSGGDGASGIVIVEEYS